MIIRDGKCYAENPKPTLKIVSARTVAPFRLCVRFNNSEERIFDGRSLFDGEVFAPLKDEREFANYRLDYETLTWCNGEIDIAPEYVYAHGVVE